MTWNVRGSRRNDKERWVFRVPCDAHRLRYAGVLRRSAPRYLTGMIVIGSAGGKLEKS